MIFDRFWSFFDLLDYIHWIISLFSQEHKKQYVQQDIEILISDVIGLKWLCSNINKNAYFSVLLYQLYSNTMFIFL